MGLFGDKTKNDMKEFEQMRQALRPTGHPQNQGEANGASAAALPDHASSLLC